MKNQADFLAGLAIGDDGILRRIYKEVFPLTRSFVHGQGGTEADAHDIFQEAVMVLYDKTRRPDFAISVQFDTYLMAVCRRLWLNRRTKKSASEVTIPGDAKLLAGDPDPALDFLALGRRSLLDRAMLRLGDDCRRLLEMFFQQMPMNQIAEALGFASEGYARRRKFQCKDRLIELIKSSPEYPELLNDD